MIADLEAMQAALAEARVAAEAGEVPIGAVVVHERRNYCARPESRAARS